MTAPPSSGADRLSNTDIRYIRHCGKPAVFKAGWVIKDPRTVLENAGIAVARGRITEILTSVPKDRTVKDCGPGILMPPLVNAHLHLELSALSGRLPLEKGFEPWVKALLRERETIGTPALIRAARHAAQTLSGQVRAWWGRSPLWVSPALCCRIKDWPECGSRNTWEPDTRTSP